MQERESEDSTVHDADIHLCIFPHLDEFLVLDVRDQELPLWRTAKAEELLTAQYYQDVEREFRRMLHSGDAPFANLMTLPQRLEAYLRRKGMQHLGKIVEGLEASPEPPRVSVFVCSGEVLAMDEEEIRQAMETFFEDGPASPFVNEYGAAFRRLLGRELEGVRAREREELRKAVQGRSSQFFTLWQRRSGPSSN